MHLPFKWDSLAFGAFPGCITRCFTLTSRFLLPRPAKVTIYATQCHHFLSFYLLLRACKEYLGICLRKDSSCASSKKREKKAAFRGAFELGQPSCGVGMYLAFWCGLRRMQPLNWDTASVWTLSEKVSLPPRMSDLFPSRSLRSWHFPSSQHTCPLFLPSS